MLQHFCKAILNYFNLSFFISKIFAKEVAEVKPVISVYLPTYNRLSLLKRAVESLKIQTFTKFEVLIVDDGSTDGTLYYLDELSLSDRRFVVVEKKGRARGACGSRNLAIESARGVFVTGLDDDDWFHQKRLEYLLQRWDDKFSAITSNHYSVFEARQQRNSYSNRVIRSNDIFYGNLVGNQIFTLRDRILAVGGFDEQLAASQDYDLWIRLITTFGPIYRCRQPLYYMDCSLNRVRISNSPARDRGTEQILIKYGGVMSSQQIAIRNRIRSGWITLPLPIKIIKSFNFGPRFFWERVRAKLGLG